MGCFTLTVVARGEIHRCSNGLGHDKRHLSDGATADDCHAVGGADATAANAMNRDGERFHQTTIGGGHACGQQRERTRRREHLFGHATVAAHAEHDGGTDCAALVLTVEAGGAFTTRSKRLDRDGCAIGKGARDLMTEGERQSHLHEVQIGAADSSRSNLHPHTLTNGGFDVDDGGLAFDASDGAHWFSCWVVGDG